FRLCDFFFSSRRRHTRSDRDWSSDVCSSDLENERLQSESRLLRGEVRELKLIVEAFRKAIGIPEEIKSADQVPPAVKAAAEAARSEERRVGKECRSRRATEYGKKRCV